MGPGVHPVEAAAAALPGPAVTGEDPAIQPSRQGEAQARRRQFDPKPSNHGNTIIASDRRVKSSLESSCHILTVPGR